MVKADPDDTGTVRTVEVALRPRNKKEKLLPYKPKPLTVIPVGVQRLVLLTPTEELPDQESEVIDENVVRVDDSKNDEHNEDEKGGDDNDEI